MIDLKAIFEKYPDIKIAVFPAPEQYRVSIIKLIDGHKIAIDHVFSYEELRALPSFLLQQTIEKLCEKVEKEAEEHERRQ